MTAPDEDPEMLAAEHALALLDGDERAAAEARMASDPKFADAVLRWRHRFEALLAVSATAPSPALWTRIAAELVANDNGDTADLVRRLHRWRLGAIAASVALVAAIGALVMRPPPATIVRHVPVASAPGPQLVATLAGSDREVVVVVDYDSATGRMLVAPARLSMPGRAAQLWVIPADGVPRSLGLFDPAAPSVHHISRDKARWLGADATIAISEEPPGGSPTALPSGPVILTGKASRI